MYGKIKNGIKKYTKRKHRKDCRIISKLPLETQEGKKIDFDILRQELSKDIIDGSKERYHLDFPGKREAIVEANRKITKTLRPIKEKSVNFDTTKNIYIEGDNLEALKILQESYLGKIKCIYIDPPYNTGNDFVYNDDFSHSEKEELEKTGRLDENGNVLTSKDINNESNGRYHSDWLKMMYPRLKLARNLLSDDGVIFISIDDNEIYNLIKLCNEVFGERNNIGTICWQKKTQPSFLSKKISTIKEYIIFFSKNGDIETMGGLTDENKHIELLNISNQKCKRTILKDNVIIKNVDFNGEIKKGLYGNADLKVELLEDINVVNGKPNKNVVLYGRFKWSQDRIDESIHSGDIYHIKNVNTMRPTIEKNEKTKNVKPILDLLSKKLNNEIPTNTDATNEIKNLFNGYSIMDFPKPTDLIKYLIRSITYSFKDSIILDYFSGSATTAHAVMKLNAEDGGNRQFIMVQLPEATKEDSEAYKAGFKNICDIGETRIRKAGEKILEEQNKTNENSNTEKVEDNIIKPVDVGFRVYKIDDSNMKDVYYTPNSILQKDILDMVSNVKEDRTEEDLLTQVILDLGLTLDLPIEEKTIKGNKIFFVSENALVACFDKTVNIDILDEIAKVKPLKMCMRESSFTKDQDKINFFERLRKLSQDTEVKTI